MSLYSSGAQPTHNGVAKVPHTENPVCTGIRSTQGSEDENVATTRTSEVMAYPAVQSDLECRTRGFHYVVGLEGASLRTHWC